MEEDEYLTLLETSDLLHICRKTLYNYIKDKKIKIIRFSRKKVLVPKKELDKFIRRYYG